MIMNNPLVSIIIPVYNTGRYVKNILDSITNQTYKNIELIIVDDGSKDESVAIINDYMADSTLNWRLLQLENGGVSRARNTGIDNANGDWIFCPDSDDFVAPYTVEYLLNSAIKYSAQCAFCEYKSVGESNISEPIRYDKGIELLTQEQLKKHFLLRKTHVIVPGMIINRSIFDNIKFDEYCPYSEDTLYTWELIYKTKKAVWVKSDLYNYLRREGSKQHTLTCEKCLSAIERYSIMTARLKKCFPNDNIAKLIQPKFVLASMHVLARCNNYKEFKDAYNQIDRSVLLNLLKMRDLKLGVFCFVYKYTPYFFYRLARVK